MNGLLLTGGSSKRMGLTKATIEMDKGISLLDHFMNILQERCIKAFVSERKAKLIHEWPVIEDDPTIEGPISGIISALKYERVSWLILACDMPYLSIGSIDQLMANRNPSVLFTGFRDQEGFNAQPFPGIWEPASLEHLLAYTDEGKRSPRDFIMEKPRNLLYIDDKKELFNMNTPDDLAQFRSK